MATLTSWSVRVALLHPVFCKPFREVSLCVYHCGNRTSRWRFLGEALLMNVRSARAQGTFEAIQDTSVDPFAVAKASHTINSKVSAWGGTPSMINLQRGRGCQKRCRPFSLLHWKFVFQLHLQKTKNYQYNLNLNNSVHLKDMHSFTVVLYFLNLFLFVSNSDTLILIYLVF